MFNGIIFNKGKVRNIKKNKKSIFITVETDLILTKKDIGSSISCDGVCLTLVKVEKNLIYFYLSDETINRSNFKYLSLIKHGL